MSEHSDHPELTPAVLAELQAVLQQRQAALQGQIADLRGQLIAPDDIQNDAPGDEGDASVDLQDRDDSDPLLQDLQAQLGEVDHALAKFDTGTYGICERCGRPIPLARLRVLPEARYDVEYEEEVEAGRAPR